MSVVATTTTTTMPTASSFSTAAELDDAVTTLRRTFYSGKTKSLAWRKWQLKQAWWMLEDNEERILAALESDLGRSDFESYMFDISLARQDILEALEHIDEWTKDEYVPGAGFIYGTLGKSKVKKEPLGVALIIGAWNFPIALLLDPAFAAIAAGCCVLLKPSEMASATQDLLMELVPKYMDPEAVRIVAGGPEQMTKVLEYKFDHIFFTGSGKIARFITAAAAKHLTPTVLELGGQGPAIVTGTADVDLAAKRIAWAKFTNAGQICLSVNHVFVDPAVYDEFVARAGFWFDSFLAGAGEKQMTKIINDRNHARLKKMLEASKGKITYAGKKPEGATEYTTDSYSSTKFNPTVVADVSMGDPLMAEELFGPILPVIKADYKTAITEIKNLDHPLAIYIFSKSQKEVDEVINTTISGGVTVNDTLVHYIVPNAPFGGVGESGSGYYHGAYGFRCFTHLRTIVMPPTWIDKLLSFRYAPYTESDVAKVIVKKGSKGVGFKRGETMADQERLSLHELLCSPLIKTVVRKTFRCAFFATALVAGLAAVDGLRGGGRSRLTLYLGFVYSNVLSKFDVKQALF
ncbi:aldehyde dehydrogenase 3I1 [Myxozyma melibiosi]|uniref:Aldehyde dehydrogenase 3I1 n=1 Tax=Myxozyma melibiosi TaxID=54550 RepID=A0ABR1FBQ4_9ASCO